MNGTRISRESTLVCRSFNRLKKIESVEVCCEVPILGRTVDMAYRQNGVFATIEFKLRDWRQALMQARDHLLAADLSYICMPRRAVSDEMRSELDETGVGLMFYCEDTGWPFEEIVEPRRSTESWDVARAWALEYFEQNKGKALWRKRRKR